jgi:hypothetical protein
MGLFRRAVQRKAAALDATYWTGVRPILEVGEQEIDYLMFELADSPMDGVAFLTNQRIIVAKWGFDRVARPFYDLPLEQVLAAKSDGTKVILGTGDWGIPQEDLRYLTFTPTNYYPAPLVDRWWQTLFQLMESRHRELGHIE